MRRYFSVGLIALAMSLFMVPPPVSAQVRCQTAGQLLGWNEVSQLAQLGCELSSRTIQIGEGLQLALPAKGMMTGTHLKFDGTGSTLPESVTAWRSPTGALGVWDSTGRVAGSPLAVAEGRKLAVSQRSAQTSQNACGTANNYRLTGRRWRGAQYRWYFNGAGYGGEGSRSTMNRAFIAMTADSSECGSGVNRSSATYAGLTTRASGAGDGYNVVSFADLPDSVLARATWWWEGNNAETVEADISFDRSNRRWFISGGTTGCSNAFDMSSVATHEVGHVFGLAHVDSGSEVMKASLGECEFLRTKRRGDLDGMRQLYR